MIVGKAPFSDSDNIGQGSIPATLDLLIQPVHYGVVVRLTLDAVVGHSIVNSNL